MMVVSERGETIEFAGARNLRKSSGFYVIKKMHQWVSL